MKKKLIGMRLTLWLLFLLMAPACADEVDLRLGTGDSALGDRDEDDENRDKRDDEEPSDRGGEEPDGCEEGCRERARNVYSDCMEAVDDEAACRTRAGEFARACAADHCEGRGEEVREDSCACGERARTVYDECVEWTADEEGCRSRAGAFMDECRVDCDGCVDACGLRARAVYNECVDWTGEEEACRRRAGEFQRQCAADHCSGTPEPEVRPEADGCEEGCGTRARQMYADCVEETGDEEGCGLRHRAFYEQCVADHCADADPEPDRCEEGCGTRARHMYADCVEETGDEEGCGLRLRAFYEQCVADHCEG